MFSNLFILYTMTEQVFELINPKNTSVHWVGKVERILQEAANNNIQLIRMPQLKDVECFELSLFTELFTVIHDDNGGFVLIPKIGLRGSFVPIEFKQKK